MYLSTSTITGDFPEMYLSTFQVLYKLYLSTKNSCPALIGSEVLFSIGLSAPDEYVEQYQLLSTEQCEARIVGDTCLSCHLRKMGKLFTLQQCVSVLG